MDNTAQNEQDVQNNDDVAEAELSPFAVVEALLFASGEPLSVDRISEVSRLGKEEIVEALQQLKTSLAEEGRGTELVEVAEKFQLRTKGQYATLVRELRASRPRRLSAPALETLAIIAYRQPIVRSDVERIRGVDVTPTLKTLLERNLVKIVGHQPTVGQPALYGTTEEFLKLFGLNSLAQLPTLRDIKELEQEPGESGAEYSAEEEQSEEVPAEEETAAASEPA